MRTKYEITDGVVDSTGKTASLYEEKLLYSHLAPNKMANFRWIKDIHTTHVKWIEESGREYLYDLSVRKVFFNRNSKTHAIRYKFDEYISA